MEKKCCEKCSWLDGDDMVCHNRDSPFLLQKRDLDQTCEFCDEEEEEQEDVFCLIEMPQNQGNSWFKRVQEEDDFFYQNPDGGRFPGKVDLIPIETVYAESFDDLDWTKTYLNISENGAGWLDREARFHGCPFQQHDRHAYRIIKQEVVDLENQGWVRVNGKLGYMTMQTLSPEQRIWLDRKGYKVEDDGYL